MKPKRALQVWAIQTPSGGLVQLKRNHTANDVARAYTRSRWPMTWAQLYAQGYRVVPVRPSGRFNPEAAYV